MKKLILLMVVVTVMINNSKAQDSGILFGLKGGANYSNQYDSKGGNFTSTSKLGFAGGALYYRQDYLQCPVSPDFCFFHYLHSITNIQSR